MNSPDETLRNELATLTSRLMADELTTAEDARLTEMLNAHPELIDEYADQLHLDQLLSTNLYAAVPEGISLETLEADAVTEDAPVVVKAAASAAAGSGFGYLTQVSVVVVLLLLVGGAYWLQNREQSKLPEESVVNTPRRLLELPAVEFVGMLLDTEDAVWADEELGDDIAYGTRFAAGKQLWLKSGIARIRFESGAGVVLEGPAQIELRSSLNAKLKYGKLAAYVPDEAHGFTVDTPKMEIVDQGTRFGTVVDPFGKAEVHVFEGEVDIKPKAQAEQPRILKASQAVLFTRGNTQGADIRVTPTKFADVPTPEQLVAAKSGNYPPLEAVPFEAEAPFNEFALLHINTALPKNILAGEAFEYRATSLSEQTGGVGFSHEGWWADPNFTRLMVPEQRMQWGGLEGGPMVLQSRGHHHAYPALAHRMARKLAEPLTEDFYFSLLVKYEGLDKNDFFGLWFDDVMGGKGSSHSRAPNFGLKEKQFFARFEVNQEGFSSGLVDGECFLLVGRVMKDESSYFNRLEFWVNPVGDRSETPDAVVQQGKGAKQLKAVHVLGMRIGQYTEVSDSLFVDRLVIGKTFASVTQPVEN
ncbi:FecR protein [Gimesia panareensis]|uniref:FecR protein n=1 Tax=Gimesia panareensis TaxID=2527978 RepID=A0A518FML5_9PLAN|nr:FecR domain-containing protein [Gimesia panareensis]QDV17591.1 FecR protein [Gimesia panareensis]